MSRSPAASPATAVRAPGERTPAPNRIQEIVDALRQRIAQQHAAPGSKLLEQDLAEEFGVPRATIREAFSALEQRGLIERIPNRGAIVSRVDMAQVFHLYDTREVLEGLCARLATQNAAPESWADLVELFGGPMVEHVARADFDSFIAGYELFRRRMTTAAANPVLAGMLDSIYEKTQVLIRRTLILPGRASVGLQEHQAVLAAMRAGDAEAAENLRRANMRSAKQYLARYQAYVL
ncbi:GntR family transcriptional regulator [Piscinibacter koreensis]|uniref:GntR family transcriptional regulator n=1 Tax=Piscinibacter koreensis TaxID=2742824 RepID=A0A7Y6NK66_9BURK|nr:GntR family transcriptional regulator [Schlegelella koreensis]NUZ04693.1 GntR family transcriptional regulator [Schlegelella koreensis]